MRPLSSGFRYLVILAALLAGLLACAPTLAGQKVKDIRIWAGDEHTRTVLDVTGPVDYRVFTLSDPARLVVDIRNARIDSEAGRIDGRGLLQGVRYAPRNDTDLRVVFDLSEDADNRSFLLPPAQQYGHRLVVDLLPKNASKAEPLVERRITDQPGRPRDVLIAIDPGHGGEDPGAIGPAGTYEKDIVLAISRRLAEVIDATEGYQALLIRDGDFYVPHRRRFEMARQARADLFVSVHADAFPDRSVRGSSVYVLSERGATSEAARYLAAAHDESDLIGGVPISDKDEMLKSVLLDLSQGATQEMSFHAADSVLGALARVGKTHKRGVEKANFAVLRSPDVPSMLVETAFISNPEEERRLNDPSHQRSLARAIFQGIDSYFGRYPPPGTLIAERGRARMHTVARGETLSGIAQRYRVAVADIKRSNDLNGDRLLAGTVLTIP